MRLALISDIHGNVEALRAVLADVETRRVEGVVCLGDIVGYGPDPLACVDLVAEKCRWSLLGNHDFGVLYEPTNFNPGAEQAAYWTRAQFENDPDEAARARRWAFLSQLRVRVKFGSENQIVAVHGSPRRPINEYVFPDDAINGTLKIQQIFERIDKCAVVGHTHVPGVFTDEPDFYTPAELKNKFTFQDGEKCMINVGSVGQPRDRDPRAAYVIVDGDEVEFIRVEYNIQVTAKRIRDNPNLDDFLGMRLFEGK